MNETTQPDGYPLDWEKPITQRGLSRVVHAGHYMVRLSLCGVQRYIGAGKTQPEAAKIYDLALWKCAPLIPGKLRPNYPEAFSEVIQRDVDTLCPHLNDLFDELVKEVGKPASWNPCDARDEKIARMGKPVEAVGIEAKNYKAYRDAIALTSGNSIRTITRISTLRNRLKFSKIPELSELADEYTSLMERTEMVGMRLRTLLAHYEQHYHGLVAPLFDIDAHRTEPDLYDDEALKANDEQN